MLTDDTRRTLLATGGLGLGASLLASLQANAQAPKWSAQEQANVAAVNAFLHSAKPRDFTAGAQYLAPEVTYRMTETSPPDKGYEAIVKRLAPFVDNADQIVFEILATQAMGPIVINHRVDRFISKTRPLLFEGVGVFFLKDGKIREWTDYTIRAALANDWPARR